MSSTASNPEIDRLAAGQYVSLVTYRKDGTAVPTPVWVSRDGDKLLVWTQADSGKVKRIRNRGHVMVAPCDARGGLQGEPVDAAGPHPRRPRRAGARAEDARGQVRRRVQALPRGAAIVRRGKDYVGIEITVP